MQELLTGLFELIFVSFTLIMVLDFVTGLKPLMPLGQPQQNKDASLNADMMSVSAPTIQDKEAIAPTTLLKPPALLPDPWTLPIDEQVTPLSRSSQQPAKFKPLLLLPPARPRLDLAALKKYVLHGKTVVCAEDITTVLPDGLKQYKLRGKSVLRLADLEAAMLSRAWLAAYGSLS